MHRTTDDSFLMEENKLFYKSTAVVFVFWLALSVMAPNAWAAEPDMKCQPVETQAIKVEGYFSKKFKKQTRAIKKEFAAMGHTRVVMRHYPMGDTSQIVAVGRCVPAFMARHILQTALKYTRGINQLVHQGFIAPHWVGVGTTMFDEASQQNVNEDQVKQLLNPDLSTEEFHALYRKFSIQDDTVPYFGLMKKNVKKLD